MQEGLGEAAREALSAMLQADPAERRATAGLLSLPFFREVLSHPCGSVDLLVEMLQTDPFCRAGATHRTTQRLVQSLILR